MEVCVADQSSFLCFCDELVSSVLLLRFDVVISFVEISTEMVDVRGLGRLWHA